MHRLTESIRALAGAFLAALALGACAPSEPWRQESYVFGTRVEVLIFGTAQDEARAASAQVLQDFDRLHRQYHAWQESDLTRLNTALAAGRPASVSPELAGLIAQAQPAGSLSLAQRLWQRLPPAVAEALSAIVRRRIPFG